MSTPQSRAAQNIRTHPIVVQAQDKATYYVSQLDKELSKYPALNHLEAKTNIPKAYGVLGTVVGLSLLILINRLAAPISNLIGWALPAYLSFRAIESPGHDDDVQWLTYWVVFGTFNFLESFALRAVLYYLPYYFVFKTAFIIWLQLPQFKGAATLYHAALRPVLNKAKKSQFVPSNVDTAPVHNE